MAVGISIAVVIIAVMVCVAAVVIMVLAIVMSCLYGGTHWPALSRDLIRQVGSAVQPSECMLFFFQFGESRRLDVARLGVARGVSAPEI